MTLLSVLAPVFNKPAIRQGLIVLVDQGFFSLATFVTGVLVARANTKEEYGIYVLAWSLLFILQGIHRALINVPFTIYAPRLEHAERDAYQGSTLIHTLILCLLFFIVLSTPYVLDARYGMDATHGIYTILPWLGVMLIPFLLREFTRNVLLAKLQFVASIRVNAAANITLLALVVAFFLTHALTAASALQLFAFTSMFSAIAMLWTQRGEFRFNWREYFAHFLKSWKTGKWVSINVVAFMGSSLAYPWLLLYFMDYHAVAVFGACFATASFLAPLLRGGSAYILPRMSHGYNGRSVANLKRLLNLSIAFLAVPFGLWMVVGSIFRDDLVPIFYSEEYSGYGVLFAILLVKVTIESVSAPLTSALQTLERADVTTVSLIIGAVVTLTAGPILINNFGLYGAGIAAVLSASATAAWKAVGVRNIFRLQGSPNANSTVYTP